MISQNAKSYAKAFTQSSIMFASSPKKISQKKQSPHPNSNQHLWLFNLTFIICIHSIGSGITGIIFNWENLYSVEFLAL